jgi:hypothetical protein
MQLLLALHLRRVVVVVKICLYFIDIFINVFRFLNILLHIFLQVHQKLARLEAQLVLI